MTAHRIHIQTRAHSHTAHDGIALEHASCPLLTPPTFSFNFYFYFLSHIPDNERDLGLHEKEPHGELTWRADARTMKRSQGL